MCEHRATNFGLFTSILSRFYGWLCSPNSSSRSLSFSLPIIRRTFERHNAEMSFGKLKRGFSAWSRFNCHVESPRPDTLVCFGSRDINRENWLVKRTISGEVFVGVPCVTHLRDLNLKTCHFPFLQLLITNSFNNVRVPSFSVIFEIKLAPEPPSLKYFPSRTRKVLHLPVAFLIPYLKPGINSSIVSRRHRGRRSNGGRLFYNVCEESMQRMVTCWNLPSQVMCFPLER